MRKKLILPHHIVHAESVYRLSGFSSSSVLTLDGMGDNDAYKLMG
ncbi:hypothetical protein J7E78_05230 [Paenibacillus polymyxa]|nr:hypothetical protein [Paenibacillus polymyxa]